VSAPAESWTRNMSGACPPLDPVELGLGSDTDGVSRP